MKYLVSILALFTTSAFAVGIGNDNPGTLGGDVTNVNTNLNNVSNRIDNDVRASAMAFSAANQRQAQGQLQGQAQSVTLAPQTGGNTLTVNTPAAPSDLTYHYDTPRNTPAFALGNVYPTTSCAHSAQIGGSGVGFSFGIGGSYLDDECGIRETARSFNGLGLQSDAIQVLCASKYAAVAATCKAIAPSQSAPRPEQQ